MLSFEGNPSPSSMKFGHEILKTLSVGYHMVKTRHLYLTWPLINTGTWHQDRQMDRQYYYIANTCYSSLIPVQWGWAGYRPNLFQVVPEALQICCKAVYWPCVPPGLIVGRTLEHQMFNCFFPAMTVWADGRVPAPNTVQVRGKLLPVENGQCVLVLPWCTGPWTNPIANTGNSVVCL